MGETAEITFEWVGDTLRHVGSAVHAWLARIAREGLEHWSAAAVEARAPVIRSMLANLGVAPRELNQACNTVMEALIRCINDTRGRWLLQPHQQSASELAITGVVGGQICEAIIDRTFIDESGIRWIVDYKTGSHKGGSVDQFLASEKLRYQEQLDRYARLFAQQEDRPVRLALYFPLVTPGWVEWDPPALIRRQAALF